MNSMIKRQNNAIRHGKIAEGWQTLSLDKLVSPLKQKAGSKKYPVLSITAGLGFVSQADKFGKEIAGAQYVHYTVLSNGDFAYNKGNSKTYPQGCIYRLDNYDQAAVPNVFNSFRFASAEANIDFYKYLFEHGYLNRQLYRYINSGVRNDGLLNLYDDDFYSCEVPLPPLHEQRKIAEILGCCDEVIRLKKALIAEKKKQKKALMQKLLFTDVCYLPESTWGNCIKLISGLDFAENNYTQNATGVPYLTGASNIVQGKIILNRWTLMPRNIALCGDILLVCKGAGVGSIAIMTLKQAHIARQFMAIRPSEKLLTQYTYQLLKYSFSTIKRESKGLIEGIDRKTILNMKVRIPPLKQQQTIADILTAADQEIDLLNQELEQQEKKKKSLMQLLLTGIVRV